MKNVEVTSLRVLTLFGVSRVTGSLLNLKHSALTHTTGNKTAYLDAVLVVFMPFLLPKLTEVIKQM